MFQHHSKLIPWKTALLFSVLVAFPLRAQLGAPPAGSGGSTSSVQLPLSGRTTGQFGTVNTTRQTASGGGSTSPTGAPSLSVNTISTSVQTQGSFGGSVPSAGANNIAVPLSFEEALRRGLRYNLGTVAVTNNVLAAQGQQAVIRSTLLPNIVLSLREVVSKTSLRSVGIRIPGIPSVVGPFNYFDLRPSLNQNVFDATAILNNRASSENVRSQQFAAQDARDLVVLAVGGTYLQVIAAQSRVLVAQAQVTTSQALYQQAVDRNRAGLNARIDALRSQVELQTQQTRLISQQTDLAKQKLNLGRLIGLPPGQDFVLTDDLPFMPLPEQPIDTLLQTAQEKRPDLRAGESAVKAAELARKAASAERLPAVTLAADYGVIGLNPSQANATFTVTGGVRVPIFEGGRIRGEIQQADAALRQRRAELEDLRARVEYEVRNALLDLSAAAQQVEVARSNRELAGQTLTQARDRFLAGVADTVEVVQAQESVATAQEDFITSVYAHNLAKVSLARSLGNAEQVVTQYVKGK